jgi:hypothetical protein
MDKIELTTPEPEKVIPVLQDAIDRQKRILLQSLTKTEENIRQLAARLGVDTDLLLAGKVTHTEEQDLDLLELEGELEISRHLREQLESLEHLTICR